MHGQNITAMSPQGHNAKTQQFSKSLAGDIKLQSGSTESEHHYSIKFAAVQSYTTGTG